MAEIIKQNLAICPKICNNNRMKRIGVYGGTFNPVHLEHVRLATTAVSQLNLDKLFIIPTFLSPHKATAPIDAGFRLEMLKLAFSGQDKIEISDYEIQNQGKSYSYLTIEHFKSLYPDSELFLLVGDDMLSDFRTWKNPERILACADLAVFGREDFFVDYQKEEEYFLSRFNKGFIKLDVVGKGISSTEIRLRVVLGLSTDGLLDKNVREYIDKNALYKKDVYTEFLKNNLTEKRLVHTINVVVTAMKKAKDLGLDENKVYLSALLHDCAKYLDHTKVDGFILPNGVPAPVVHSFLGAFVAEKVLGITDSEILDAIRFHTSGKAEMTTLSKLIFVADMVEKGRDYLGVDKLRELYDGKDFEKCFIECLKEEFLHLLNKKQYIYEQTLNAFRYYIKD